MQIYSNGGAAKWLAPLLSFFFIISLAFTPSSADAMTRGSVAEFLDRADKLAPLGPFAIAAPDAQRLKAEVIAAARRYKARNDAQRDAGHVRTSCPPEDGDLQPEDWLRHLRSYSKAQRSSISIDQAFNQYMIKNYPCPRSASLRN